MFWNICSVCFMMLAEKKAPQQVSAAVLIPFRRERARALRVLALAAITTTTAPQGTTAVHVLVRLLQQSLQRL